jgi:CheY-like chemotaxis protein
MSAPLYAHSTPHALFQAVGADSAAFCMLARLYLDSAPAARWRALRAAGGSAALAALCHEMRGSAVVLGAAALGAELAACEAHARAGKLPPPAQLAAVENELALVQADVERALTQFGAPRPATPRILVVDDDALSRALLCLQLGKAGCRAEEASDGAAALAALRLQPYHLVLMDLHMPVLDGYQASAAWRGQESAGGPRLCIVGVSAGPAHADGRWQEAGMDELLRKPVSPQALGELLARRLSWRTPQ